MQGFLYLKLRDPYGNDIIPASSLLSLALNGTTTHGSGHLGAYDVSKGGYQMGYLLTMAEDYAVSIRYGEVLNSTRCCAILLLVLGSFFLPYLCSVAAIRNDNSY